MSGHEPNAVLEIGSVRRQLLMVIRGALLLTLVLLFSIMMLLTMTSCSGNNGNRLTNLQKQNDSLNSCLQLARTEIEELRNHANQVKTDSSSLDGLRIANLSHARINLADDLRKHPELLPQEKRCEAGGKFIFWPDRIYKVSDCWVMAYFEDGLCGGHIILEYKITDSGTVIWKPLAFKML